ncbi:MAG: UDP-N-acetylglucosamine 2-epimerase [Methanoregulaceae archaeon]|nr:UDP-N-acetylglucosamine 2-epimerase [Methanoregulaceae archaeon]
MKTRSCYLEFLHLVSNARLIITDSGGLQEETWFLGQ